MLTDQEMLGIAEHYMLFESNNIELKLIYSNIIKKPYGNIFSYDSKKHIETGDFKYHIPGSAPFLVEKKTGRVVNFGTAQTLEFYLDAYEKGTLKPTLDRYWYPDEERYSHK